MDDTRPDSRRRQFGCARLLLWTHIVVVAFLTVVLHQTHDLHAAQGIVLQLLLPASLSVFLYPPALVVCLYRRTNDVWPSIIAESVIELMHLNVLAAGFASY